MMKLSEIVAQLGGELIGEDSLVAQLSPLKSAKHGEISFYANPKFKKDLDASEASALIVRQELIETCQQVDRSLIVTPNPYLYFAKVAGLFFPQAKPKSGTHNTAIISDDATVARSAEIGANACIGAGVKIGERCIIHPSVVIEPNTIIGDDVILYPNVTIYHDCVIGDRCIIHSGAVIGSDGFGNAWDADHWFKIPQNGRAIIGSDVEIGANTTIDRGAMADTIIADGARIDNLVQIAHNCQIGKNTAIAGCVGIAGSTKIGANCTIGGAVMMVGHIEIADGTHIGGGTLVSKSIRKPDNYASSYPMSTSKDWLSNAVHLRHLDTLVNRVKSLEKALEQLQQEMKKD